ncbi:MAG: NADP-dependent oxidoreductase [Pseudomonadota bacterium]|nr:NADP-dependent oxidoreductase [Pseudomonadota bacterium]
MSDIAAVNQRIVLASRPAGKADERCFRLEETPLPPIRDGEILLRTMWLSLDPYMRGRMNDAPSYAPPVAVGSVMTGGTVGRVERSLNPAFRVGEQVLAMSGWQQYAVSNGSDVLKLPADMAHPSHALGVLGMPGFTAYIGLLDIGKPVPGETVVVAAATGAVGSVVGQIAKIKGCRVVGIAGGLDKCDWAVRHQGFDACVDHRSADFAQSLARACPQGIDVYFENVGGHIFRTVVPLLNEFSRIPVCGLISLYGAAAAPPADGDSAQAFLRAVLTKRITVRGFIVFDEFAARRTEILAALSAWVEAGQIVYREDIVHGLANAPAAFLGLLEGRNFGKLVVDVGESGT